MTQRIPTGVLVVITDNTGPMTHEEFDRWYDGVHVPDVLDTGCYYAATRYESTGESEGRYLAIYETDWDDPIGAFEQLPSRLGHMRKYDGLVIRHLAAYTSVGGEHKWVAPADKQTIVR